jgi:hypothetical protein
MEQINTCDVLFRGGGKKNMMFFFPPEKPKMFAGRWCPTCDLGKGIGPKILKVASRAQAKAHLKLLKQSPAFQRACARRTRPL